MHVFLLMSYAENSGLVERLFITGRVNMGGGGEVKIVKRLKDLKEENTKLKKMFADVRMENYALNGPEELSISAGTSPSGNGKPEPGS